MAVATSNLGDCNSPGESLSCSFIFDILMTTTAQDCEKGRGSPSSCRPRGDAGTRHPGALRSQEPLPADSSPAQVPLWSNQSPFPILLFTPCLLEKEKSTSTHFLPPAASLEAGAAETSHPHPVPAPTVAGSVARYQLSLTHCSPRWFSVGGDAPPTTLALLPAPCPGLARGDRRGRRRRRGCCCTCGSACVTPPGPQFQWQLISLGNTLLTHPSSPAPAAEIWGLLWSLAQNVCL